MASSLPKTWSGHGETLSGKMGPTVGRKMPKTGYGQGLGRDRGRNKRLGGKLGRLMAQDKAQGKARFPNSGNAGQRRTQSGKCAARGA